MDYADWATWATCPPLELGEGVQKAPKGLAPKSETFGL